LDVKFCDLWPGKSTALSGPGTTIRRRIIGSKMSQVNHAGRGDFRGGNPEQADAKLYFYLRRTISLLGALSPFRLLAVTMQKYVPSPLRILSSGTLVEGALTSTGGNV
jgi:hypothetical protein